MLIETNSVMVWDAKLYCAICYTYNLRTPYNGRIYTKAAAIQDVAEQIGTERWAYGITEDGEEIGICPMCLDRIGTPRSWKALGFTAGTVTIPVTTGGPKTVPAILYKELAVHRGVGYNGQGAKTFTVSHTRTGLSLSLEDKRRASLLPKVKHLANTLDWSFDDAESLSAEQKNTLSAAVRAVRKERHGFGYGARY